MLLVETIVMPSEAVNGLGLFSTEYIVRGKIVWKSTWAEEAEWLDNPQLGFSYSQYGWYDPKRGKYVIPQDEGRYIRCPSDKILCNLLHIDGTMIATEEIFNRDELLVWYKDYMVDTDVRKLTEFDEEPVEEASILVTPKIEVIGESKSRTAWRDPYKNHKD